MLVMRICHEPWSGWNLTIFRSTKLVRPLAARTNAYVSAAIDEVIAFENGANAGGVSFHLGGKWTARKAAQDVVDSPVFARKGRRKGLADMVLQNRNATRLSFLVLPEGCSDRTE